MDPRYRFTLVMSILLVTWWVWVMVSTFMWGPQGLTWLRYQHGAVLIGLSVLGGLGVVWLALKLIVWQRSRKTGFEAEPTDEFGTAFEMTASDGTSAPFRMALSKFQPALIAPPLNNASLHPLEAELMGFLHGFRHWPSSLSTPDISLYEKSVGRWQVMSHIPNCTPWHRIAALSRDLAVAHALEERRTPAPWYHFLTPDKVTFRLRSTPRTGLSALVLSTMPAFRALAHTTPQGDEVQRALLAALRFSDNPQTLPLNAGPLATSLVEGLTRTEAQLGQLDISDLDKLTPARREALAAKMKDVWLNMLSGFTPQPTLEATTQLYRAGGATPTQWLSLSAMLEKLGPMLEADLRTTLQLWDAPATEMAATQHPAWSHLLPLLQEQGFIATTHAGVEAEVGTFRLEGAKGEPWGPCLKLNLGGPDLQGLSARWQNLPTGPAAELALEPAVLKVRAEQQVQLLNTKLRDLF